MSSYCIKNKWQAYAFECCDCEVFTSEEVQEENYLVYLPLTYMKDRIWTKWFSVQYMWGRSSSVIFSLATRLSTYSTSSAKECVKLSFVAVNKNKIPIHIGWPERDTEAKYKGDSVALLKEQGCRSEKYLFWILALLFII